ncbi:serine/threonine-protein phosphatase 6 regulatory ankyrin repeat subunit A [Halyomorpha halys]|uniref:serine/threonine-protein phosphatase 6 regulatory ankyrin repeat subunit A n=1 Tax=Halyomorpha halys TaxID=286706 RepID=UPI0006D4DAB3|nr:serine/threonine-protein phosphatase 6 regulatory ankyrin repeat subunit A [Halyomorpha halys]
MLLFVLSAIFAHQCLAISDDGSEVDFEQFLTVGNHMTCNIEKKFPPLHRAAMTGNIQLATRTILELKKSGGKCINHQDSEGETALHWAAVRRHGAIVRSLLESGANVTYVDKCNNTALHAAAFSGDAKSVRWLIIFGADPNAKNINGSTPLHVAVVHNHFEIVEHLISSCANLNATDNRKRTPLDLAIATNNMALVVLLRAAGSSSLRKSETFRWVNQTAGQFDLPKCAVKGGKTYGGQMTFPGRVWHQNGYIPATIIPYHKKVITVIDGKYKKVSGKYQVLCGDILAWKPKKADANIPGNAVIFGKSSKGDKLYIGRTYVSHNEKEVMTLGQVCGKDKILRMPFYSKSTVETSDEYEILIMSY